MSNENSFEIFLSIGIFYTLMFVIPYQVHFERKLHLHILDILIVPVKQHENVDYQLIH